MTHISAGMATARTKIHNGHTQMVRDTLAASGKPMSAYAITYATGLKPEQVRRSLAGVMSAGGSGGISKFVGSNGVTYYQIYRPAAPKPVAHPERMATSRTIPAYRWFV